MVLKILNNLKSVNRQALYPLVVMACAESPLTPSSMSLVCWWSSPYGYMFLVCWFASPYDYMFFLSKCTARNISEIYVFVLWFVDHLHLTSYQRIIIYADHSHCRIYLNIYDPEHLYICCVEQHWWWFSQKADTLQEFGKILRCSR